MSEAFKTELVNFSNLSSEASGKKRAELAKHVAVLFSITSERCSDEQVDIYDSVLLRLVGMVETEVRVFVADRLAALRRGPEQTVRRLAGDEIDVAESILRNSPVLREADLISIADSQSNHHRLAIAKRDVLSPDVTDVLVKKGDRVVKREVASNSGASFSGLAMTRLVEDSSDDECIQVALSERSDLADKHIKRLVSVATDRVRARLVETGQGAEAARLDRAADLAAQRMSNEYWLGRYDFETARSRILALAQKGLLNENTLRKLAAEDRFAEVVAAFAWLTRCGVQEASHWMVRLDLEPFLVVSKANGLSAMTVGLLLEIGPWRHRLSPRVRKDALGRFNSMNPAEANRKMAHWSQIVMN